MKVVELVDGFEIWPDDCLYSPPLTNRFFTLEALENHIKLMLIAVQQYKEKKVD